MKSAFHSQYNLSDGSHVEDIEYDLCVDGLDWGEGTQRLIDSHLHHYRYPLMHSILGFIARVDVKLSDLKTSNVDMITHFSVVINILTILSVYIIAHHHSLWRQ